MKLSNMFMIMGKIILILNMDSIMAKIYTQDIQSFQKVLEHINSETTFNVAKFKLEREYFLNASDGLKKFTELRLNDVDDFVQNVLTNLAYYKSLPEGMYLNDEKLVELNRAINTFKHSYKDYKEPNINFLVGMLNSGRTAYNRNIFIGAEIFTDRTPPPALQPSHLSKVLVGPSYITQLVFHEMIHIQQDFSLIDDNHPEAGSLLIHAIAEGCADFLTKLHTGAVFNKAIYLFGEEHEQYIWGKFKKVMYGEDFSLFLYNSATSNANWPPDLGYYVGFRIAESYYETHQNDVDLIKDMLNISNFTKFLKDSQYEAKLLRNHPAREISQIQHNPNLIQWSWSCVKSAQVVASNNMTLRELSFSQTNKF